MTHRRLPAALLAAVACLLLTAVAPDAGAAARKQKKAPEDPYADYVWPPPPDRARIKLDTVIEGRRDVEGRSRLGKLLIGASPEGPYDKLNKPYAVDFDPQGRLLVTDWGSSALLRFDREGGRMDVFGTRGTMALQQPLGLGVGPDGRIYVADVGLARVVAYDAEGDVVAVYGRPGELTNPTDAAVSPDGKRLYVTDSKEHRVVVFDIASAERLTTFGRRGVEDGELNFPTALVFGPEGNLFVLDQINARVQLFAADGEFIDRFGELGRVPGSFTRPKDVAVDEVGFIYVTDNAFNNVQLFDADFTLLTFVGSGGQQPGQFLGASGVAVHGDLFAIVDQLGHRLQVFRFIVPKDE
jgi:hypothetical protein